MTFPFFSFSRRGPFWAARKKGVASFWTSSAAAGSAAAGPEWRVCKNETKSMNGLVN
jgi:hypothetical protein